MQAAATTTDTRPPDPVEPPIDEALAALSAAADVRLRELLDADTSVAAPVEPLEFARLALGQASNRYTVLDDATRAADANLRAADPALAQHCHRVVVAAGVARFTLAAARCRYPESVTALYPGHLRRMLAQLDSMDDAFFDLADDRFLKDLAILTHRLVPVGAELVQLDSGVPRRVLLAGGPRQLLRGLTFWLFEAGALRPFFDLHTHVLALEDFNPAGWNACYARLAELLELNPGVRGWLSASWFLDPQLETVSPHLVYLRKVPEEGGAAIFYVSQDRKGLDGALATSATRRRLFDSGDYVPTVYMRAWSRRAVLQWHRRWQLL